MAVTDNRDERSENGHMSEPYVYLPDLSAEVLLPPDGILSRPIHTDERSKIILFHFAPGQELIAHTAPFPATIYIVRGDAKLTLGGDEQEAHTGTFVYMTPQLEHGIKAQTEVVMLLTMVKGK
jgi:quercetin dioxygenase-like cupin family protein